MGKTVPQAAATSIIASSLKRTSHYLPDVLWRLNQSNLAFSTQLAKIASTIGVSPLVLFTYLARDSSVQLLSKLEISQRMMGIFGDNFDVDALVIPSVALRPMIQRLNVAAIPLGWRWVEVKAPKHRADALILAVVLPDGEKMALKIHLAKYRHAYTNYMTTQLRAKINSSPSTTTINAHEILQDKKTGAPFHVVIYPFVEGTPLVRLDLKNTSQRIELLKKALFEEGLLTTHSLSPADILLTPQGTLVLTDWNKIQLRDPPLEYSLVELPEGAHAPDYYQYRPQIDKPEPPAGGIFISSELPSQTKNVPLGNPPE